MWYTWTNSSLQRMKAIGRQEMACSELKRARSNCYNDKDYDGNAYGGSHNRDAHYTIRSQIGIGNFSSRAKTFDHIPYDDCCENSPYDVHKGYHGSHHYSDQSCGREVNRKGLIGENDYNHCTNDQPYYINIKPLQKTITTTKEPKNKKLLIYYKNRMMEPDNNS
ncbi:hypothetical protein M9H77_23510 [Catharanthus roseus]|uniref:Uncharacterized protein n=1 Tax=Catharanthus roseus TaxID=4058 RepID=A0ACC0AW05_CATRO|nr:hypothetical protein M9H77_23510 [Catharanthus roseus]